MIRLPSGKSVWRRQPHALFVFGLGSTIRLNTNSLFGPLFGAEANIRYSPR